MSGTEDFKTRLDREIALLFRERQAKVDLLERLNIGIYVMRRAAEKRS